MNARPPHLGPLTCNPCADAERWENSQETSDERAQEIERFAASLVLSKLMDDPTANWFRFSICAGAMYSPDEIMAAAVDEDIDSRDAYIELMASPATHKLMRAIAAWFGREHAQDIYDEHTASTQ